jgi:hypothetical protein
MYPGGDSNTGIPASQRLQIYALDRVATGIGHFWPFIVFSTSSLGAAVCLLTFLLWLIVCNNFLRLLHGDFVGLNNYDKFRYKCTPILSVAQLEF